MSSHLTQYDDDKHEAEAKKNESFDLIWTNEHSAKMNTTFPVHFH